MRYGFDIYRITSGSTQEPASPWGWTPRRGEVNTGEHVVQEHDNTLTYVGADPELAQAFGRGSRLSQVSTLRPELVFYPSAYDRCSPDSTMFASRQRRKNGLEDLMSRAGGLLGRHSA